MKVALLSAAERTANPYIDLLCGGLADAGLDVTLLQDPGADGLPAAARTADIVHLHWLELWGRPAYRSLAGLGRWGLPGRGLRRVLEPRLNTPAAQARSRQRFLERFFDALASYRAIGGRVVYTLHNLDPHDGENASQERAALQHLLALADAVHVHAPHLVAPVQALLPVTSAPQPRIVVIPHGHYLDAYPNTLSRSDARAALDLPADGVVFLVLGLIRPYKGLEELLPAFRSLPDPAARLLLAGRPRPTAYGAEIARLAAADGRVRWSPHFVPNEAVQQWMNAADVVALPYRQISTSGAAMLAWSFGKPVLAPALPAFVEPMSRAPELGLLYDPQAPDGLLNALRQAAAIDWTAQRQAILTWVSQFDWPGIGQRLREVYQSVR